MGLDFLKPEKLRVLLIPVNHKESSGIQPRFLSRSRKEQAWRMRSKGTNVRTNKFTFCSYFTICSKYIGIISISCVFFFLKLRILLSWFVLNKVFHFLNKHELVFEKHHLTLQLLSTWDNSLKHLKMFLPCFLNILSVGIF